MQAYELPVRIVLIRPRNPLNMGAAARAMANFGLSDLVLVEPYGDAWRVARSARAGAKVLRNARVALSLSDALSGCRYVIGTTAGTNRDPEMPLEDWSDVAAGLPSVPTAFLFGSEKTGLGVEEISYCDRLARIATLPGAPSLNLGQAVAICVYELTRRRPVPSAVTPDLPIPVEERERVLQGWYPLLEAIGSVRAQHRASQTRRLRRMVARWRLSAEDERRLLGIARELKRFLQIR